MFSYTQNVWFKRIIPFRKSFIKHPKSYSYVRKENKGGRREQKKKIKNPKTNQQTRKLHTHTQKPNKAKQNKNRD